MSEMDEAYQYCPRCGAEYDAGIEKCADCFVDLVSASEMRELQSGAREEKPSDGIVHVTGDPEEARYIADSLSENGVPAIVEPVDTKAAGMTFRPGWIFHVVVEPEQEEKARFIIQFDILGEPAAGEEEAEEYRENEDRLDAAIEAGQEGLEALIEFFGGVPEVRHAAVKAALNLSEAGRSAVVEWVKRICMQEDLEPGSFQSVGDACMFLGAADAEMAAAELSYGLTYPESWVRRNFAFALGKLGSEEAIPHLVSALRDPDRETRHEAMDHLYRHTHTDLGYNPDLEPEEQAEALAKWDKLAARKK